MANEPLFQLNEAHIYFSTELFSTTWEYIEQADQRSIDEDMTMLHPPLAESNPQVLAR